MGRRRDHQYLEEEATLLLLGLGRRGEDNTDGLIKHILETLLGEGRALKILGSANILLELQALVVRDGGGPLLSELLDGGLIVPQINLGANEDHGSARGVVGDLWVPLVLDIVKGGLAQDGKAHQEDIGLRVGEGTETIIIFLT